jgi:HSP20 family molecular chaperone IbpA
MSRVPSLSSPFLLGFDEIERALDRVAKAPTAIRPTTSSGSPARTATRAPAITLAVAGFTRDQLDVTVEENQLVIRGRQQDDKSRNISTAASPRANSSAPSCWRTAWRCWART